MGTIERVSKFGELGHRHWSASLFELRLNFDVDTVLQTSEIEILDDPGILRHVKLTHESGKGPVILLHSRRLTQFKKLLEQQESTARRYVRIGEGRAEKLSMKTRLQARWP